MRQLPDEPVFSRADLRRCGWSDSAVTRAVRSGRLVTLRRGMIARPDARSTRALAAAAVRDIAGSVISHRTALIACGLPVVGARPRWPEITVAPSARGSARRALLHRATLWERDVLIDRDGNAMTSVARTVVDVARAHPVATAVAAIDAALNRQLTSLDEIDDVLLRCWNWPGIGRAQRSMRRVDGRAESALESISRLAIADLGLPTPTLQTLARDRDGFAAGRLDFYWDEFGVAGEADGRGKYGDRSVLVAEKERQERLEDDALVVVRWGWDEARYRTQLLRQKLESGFARGSARDRSGIPRLWSIPSAKPVTGRENPALDPERGQGDRRRPATAARPPACP